MSSNRMHFPNTIHFITNRCKHEMFLLLPTERITEIIQCWFARALSLFGAGLEIYAFIFLSNHFHILCNDTKGTLAAFMCYFQANVAKAINCELGRKGRFWSREYDDLIVDGESELQDRYAYVIGNAVKAGLVDSSNEWIGWSSLNGALSDGRYSFEMLNLTRLHNATRRGQKVDKSKFIETWSCELTISPFLEGKSKDERNRFIEGLLKRKEAEYRAQRDNKPPLGVANVLIQHTTDRPLNPSFRQLIFVGREEYPGREAYQDIHKPMKDERFPPTVRSLRAVAGHGNSLSDEVQTSGHGWYVAAGPTSIPSAAFESLDSMSTNSRPATDTARFEPDRNDQ